MNRSKSEKQPNAPIPVFVKNKRKELGYSQKDFALRAGVGLNFLRDLEQGKTSVRLDKVIEVLGFFGYEPAPQIKEKRNK